MASELTGKLDTSQSLRDLDDDEDQEVAPKANNIPRTPTSTSKQFTVHDLADEEVHFSLSSSDQYYQYHGNLSSHNHANHINNNNNHMASFNSVAAGSTSPTGKHSFTDISLNPIGGHSVAGSPTPGTKANSSLASHQQAPPQVVQDQLTSNRILNSISNKLRRGSNYLIAPKLVGQYLLGITIQSWSEFLNTSRMLRAPTNRQQLTRRLVNNLNYFQGNYLCVSMILIIYCILTSPLLLLAIAGLLLAVYLVTARSALGKQMRLMGYRLNLQQQYSCLTMVWIPLLWVAGAPSAVFWVIGASFFVVGLHATMYANETRLSAPDASSGSAVEYHQATINGVQYEHRLSGNQIADNLAPSGSHWELNNHASSLSSQYYNHYQQDSLSQTRRQLYTALPLESPSLTANNLSKDKLSSSTGGGFMSGAFSQWISFGASNRSPVGGDLGLQATKNSGNYQRIPEVKIISQDYAGLGRVYEV